VAQKLSQTSYCGAITYGDLLELRLSRLHVGRADQEVLTDW